MRSVEIRKRYCPKCHNRFWVDCDDTDYPVFCPFCGEEPAAGFIKDQDTSMIEENTDTKGCAELKIWQVNGKEIAFIGDAEAAVYAALKAERLEKYLDEHKLRKEIRGLLCDMEPGETRDFLGVNIVIPN